MKYDPGLGPEQMSPPHVILAELLGTGKRVLDVGCSTGLLAAALTERGNKVSGVEIDPEAAERARPVLEELVVGNLDQLDLSEAFGGRRFDAVVFADVLEHLRDPARTLCQAKHLLEPDGEVLFSVPNVAHGAVRLSLLAGRLDYQELGLLDETHIQFFTRSSLLELLWSAGYVVKELRRTTADPFQTEIPVASSEVPPEAVERVNSDPDSFTYQFVGSAVPVDTGEESGLLARLVIERDRRLHAAAAALRTVAGEASRTPDPPVVGLLSLGRPPSDDLRLAIMLSELRRRLPEVRFQPLLFNKDTRPVGVDGEPGRPVLPWGTRIATDLAADLAALVVIGTIDERGERPAELESLLRDASQRGLPTHLVGLAGNGAVGVRSPASPSALCAPPGSALVPPLSAVPDLLALCNRLAGREDLWLRAELWRALGRIPKASYVITDLDMSLGKGLVRNLKSAARAIGAEAILLLAGADSGSEVPSDARQQELVTVAGLPAPENSLDLLGVLKGAELVVSDRTATLFMASALGRPTVGLGDAKGVELWKSWAGGECLCAEEPEQLAAMAQLARAHALAGPEGPQGPPSAMLDLFLDELAESLIVKAADRVARSGLRRLIELEERITQLETVNQSLRHSMARERAALADAVRRAHPNDDAGGLEQATQTPAAERAARSEARLTEAREEIARLRAELAAVYATRTMRVLAPARDLYGRIRSLRR